MKKIIIGIVSIILVACLGVFCIIKSLDKDDIKINEEEISVEDSINEEIYFDRVEEKLVDGLEVEINKGYETVHDKYTQGELKKMYENEEFIEDTIYRAKCDMNKDGKDDIIEVVIQRQVDRNVLGKYFVNEECIIRINDVEKINEYCSNIDIKIINENGKNKLKIIHSYDKRWELCYFSYNEIITVENFTVSKLEIQDKLTLKNGRRINLICRNSEDLSKNNMYVIDVIDEAGNILDSNILGLYMNGYDEKIKFNDYNGDGNPDFVWCNWDGNYDTKGIISIYTILENGKIKKLSFDSNPIFYPEYGVSLTKVGDKTFRYFPYSGKGLDTDKNFYFSWNTTKQEFFEIDEKEFFEDIFYKLNSNNLNTDIKNGGILKPTEISELTFYDIDDAYEYYEEKYGPSGDSVWIGQNLEYEATSTLNQKNFNYSVDNLANIAQNNSWVEGVDGLGIGEKIKISGVEESEHLYWRPNKYLDLGDRMKNIIAYTILFLFEDGRISSLEEITDYYYGVNKISIINGYGENEELWKANSRVKKLKLVLDNKVEYILELEDTRGVQLFDIDYKNENIGKPIAATFEILEVYKGDKYDDTALTYLNLDIISNIEWGGR